jgi:DNA-binding response OmpR family regulator
LRGLNDNFRAADYDVETAADGEAGLAQVLAQPPDLLLLDIMLPLLNGYDLCQRVRQADLDFPILMLTAKGQEEEIVRGLELGADDYMTKPFGIRELLARAKRLLRRRLSDVPDCIEIGGALFDRTSHTLTRDGDPIPLTTKEYRLLDFFVAHPHRALTRNDIMNQVWGRSIIVSGRSVDRCVATLRSKIEPEPTPIHPHHS